MSISKDTIRDIERKLTCTAEDYEAAHNMASKERLRGYCQGIGYVLEQIGFRVEWDNGKAYIVEYEAENKRNLTEWKEGRK